MSNSVVILHFSVMNYNQKVMKMNSLILIFAIAAAFIILVAFLLYNSQKNMREMMKMMNFQMSQSQGNLNKTLGQSAAVIGDIQQKLGSLENATKQIQDIGKDISSLQNILSAPKLRGNLGEYLLYELLRDVLPAANYEEQHHFKDGGAVDAVVKLGKYFVPVDSKFPMESFVRFVNAKDSESKKKSHSEFLKSVKARIDEISKKYIRPQEGTFDFALMYIPAENVYYEILVRDGEKGSALFNYAMSKKVVPVSPSTFYAYLMSISFGLRGYKIEQQAQKIVSELSSLENSFSSFCSDFEVLGKHLANASGKYDELERQCGKLNEKLSFFVEHHS